MQNSQTLRFRRSNRAKPNEYSNQVNKVILFTNARDEKNMKEWAAHHLLIGFDNIVIFDHKSAEPIAPQFSNFDKRVQVIRCEMTNPVKIPLIQRAVKMGIASKADWILYLDADEFLVLNAFSGVKHMLSTYYKAHSLSINWLMFGTSHHINEPEGLIIENYTKSDLIVDQHVKTFVRPQEVERITNPHFYYIYSPGRMITINKTIMNNSYGYAWNPSNIPFFKINAFVAHYIFQSEETYMKRKISIEADDGSGYRNKDPKIHEYHNGTDNQYIKNKYAVSVKKFINSYM